MVGERASPPIPVSTNRPLLNLAEAAAWLRIGQSTLRQKLYAGHGPPAIKLAGSDRWRFRPSDLEDFIKAGEISPAAKNGEAA
jgi:predicted DNA-binding transcriptional regulator AlpA